SAEDLWLVAKKQLDIVYKYLQPNGLIDYETASREWWVFFDWRDGLHKEVALQGFSIFALQETYELAKLLGKEKELADIPSKVKKMKAAAHKSYYDKNSGFFIGKLNPQISYVSQIWMTLGGVATHSEAARALMALPKTENVVRTGAPYAYHYYIQALLDCGLHTEARQALSDYWGDMITRGADTFWEVYSPTEDKLSPYGFFPINSYCHAWSCTPVYFIRKYTDIFQNPKIR
ncbi:MAG: glycoside hydrolase, partial [Dysgonamonadaceae bacterium]|nr:glycoside hydrolase [Dysgonamonadaceae bacterium]